MTKLTKARRARDRWETACPIAFVVMFVAGIFSSTLGPWPIAAAVVAFVACNIGFFWCDARVHSIQVAAYITDNQSQEGESRGSS